MSFQMPITIRSAIENVDKKNYLLPAIQRDFVWKPDQIERLFDSLMRDYPIGSFLFWKVEGKRKNDFQFYEFMDDYSKFDNTHNPEAKIIGEKDIISILDGQQRLTALNIGLRGTYAYKIPYRRYDNPNAYPERHLYLNLIGKSDEMDMAYDFKFLSQEDLDKKVEGNWFKVGDILDFKEIYEINDYLIENIKNRDEEFKFANKTLFKLYSVINEKKLINYYLEEDEELDKVLNIFIRVNSGGTFLSYSDLLLSIAIAQFQEKDARKEINSLVDKINKIGSGFNFDKDFVLKACLVLNDFKNIAFKVDNFKKENMLKIEENWEIVSKSLYLAIKLLESYGYNRDLIASNNSVIPIAYYILKKGAPHNFIVSQKYSEDRMIIQKWFNICQLKRTFGGTPDNVLRIMRKNISEKNDRFPFKEIATSLRGTPKSLDFDENDIDSLFYYTYGRAYTFSTLGLLYPTLDFKNLFHMDHIHPKSFFTDKKLREKNIPEEKIEFYKDNFNYIENLQLLEGTVNEEKLNSDFKSWLSEKYPNENERKDFMRKNYIPDIDLSFDNFEDFTIQRRELMTKKFESILKF